MCSALQSFLAVDTVINKYAIYMQRTRQSLYLHAHTIDIRTYYDLASANTLECTLLFAVQAHDRPSTT